MYVLLFDIDGTLIQTGGAGGVALMSAFRDQFGVENPAAVPFSGRTDRGIVRNLFELHGIDETADNWQRLRDAYLERLPESLASHRGRVLAGVQEILDRVEPRDDVAVGLLTGNLRQGARLKLSHYGIFDAFSFGGYGDDHVHRNDVARAAQVAAQPFLQREVQRTWVIGDTPLDVQCGRAIEAHVLAVATGLHPRDELAAAKPDVLLDDLSDAPAVLNVLLGST